LPRSGCHCRRILASGIQPDLILYRHLPRGRPNLSVRTIGVNAPDLSPAACSRAARAYVQPQSAAFSFRTDAAPLPFPPECLKPPPCRARCQGLFGITSARLAFRKAIPTPHHRRPPSAHLLGIIEHPDAHFLSRRPELRRTQHQAISARQMGFATAIPEPLSLIV
jgi:hypothetical protein